MDTHDNDDELKLCWIHKVAMIKKEKHSDEVEKDVYFECPMCKDILKV